ncbi:MAG TPA: SRPBCC domain-containing protein [Bacteroidia bacterium]|jgi:uncharacterized protein YndB with AHSA1/START domain|nr:SRPBCC domain-containing protein [Bacteroidia bacterium]
METTKNKTQALTIKRTFNTPLDKVWKAWSDPETFKKWWGPKNYTCPQATIDFKVGGKLHACMKDKKDGKETWSIGTFKEIVPNKRIVVTDSFADKNGNIISASETGMKGMEGFPETLLIKLNFVEDHGKTEMTLEHEGMPEAMQEDCRKGWEESLDKIDQL